MEVKVPVPVQPEPCKVSHYPVPVELEGYDSSTDASCPEGYVCITVDSTIKMVLTKRDADRFYKDVKACPFVKEDETQYNALDRYLSTGTPLPTE